MDELTMFAELRPDDSLSNTDLDELRSELFPNASPTAHLDSEHPGSDQVVLPFVAAPQSDVPAQRRRPSRIAFAAAAVGAIGLGGLWVIADRSGGTPPTVPASQPAESPSTLPAATGVSAYDMPLVGLTEPGWTVTGAADNSGSSARAVVWLSKEGFDGPWIEFSTENPGTVNTVPSGDSTIEINGAAARQTDIENGVILRWTDPAGNPIEAFGWRVDIDQLIALADQVAVSDTGITVAALPAGAGLADKAAGDALGRYAEYRFTHADGREVQISFQPGGERGLYQRQGPEADFGLGGRTDIVIGGEPATIIDYAVADPGEVSQSESGHDVPSPGGEYRVDIQRGFWTWEFNSSGFDSEQQVVDLVAGATVVDTAAWSASLGDNIVVPAERADAASDLLEDVELPLGFDVDSLTVQGTNDRYQFIADVSAAVACGWFDEWFAGEADNDSDRRDKAAAALAASHNWPMLIEIADQGGWPAVLWRYADNLGVVNGTTHQQVNEGLGCHRFG